MNKLNTPFRRFLNDPSLTAVAVLTLALGVVSCSRDKEPVSVAIVDSQGNETRLKGGLNAGVASAVGSSTVVLKGGYPDGTAASDLPFRLELPLPSTNVLAASGLLSAQGEATLHGLAGAKPPAMYSLYVDGEPSGIVGVDSDQATNRFEFLLAAKPGMKAPNLPLVDLRSGRKFNLSDLQGEVVFIEFYTTHCAPCQPILGKLNDLVARRGAEWNGKATILAIGLDAVFQPDPPGAVAKHLERKRWRSLRPVVPDQAFSWEGAKRPPFGVNGVPYSFLIDREGVIRWSGHPEGANVENQIDELLKAETR